MEWLGIGRVLLLMLAMIAFFYLARRLKGILLPALVLIGTGFGLIMLDLIVRSLLGSGFLFDIVGPRTSPLVGTAIGYIGQIVGIFLLMLGFYRVNRVVVDMTERQRLEEERRIMGEALAESERRYRRFFEEDVSGNFISTPEGRILVCNSSFARIFGYDSPEEVLSSDANSFYENPEARKRYLELLSQKRKLVNYREQLRKKDGSPVYVTTNINTEFSETGELVQIQGYVIDETERVRAEQTMHESIEQLRKVFEEGPVGMMLFNLDWEVLRANDAFCQMIAYAEEELRTLSLRGITHPDDLSKDDASAQRLLSGGITNYRTEKRYITKTGDIIWGLATMSLVRESDGTPLYGIGIIEDITARKKGEEELERSLSLLRATLESTADGILVVNEQGRIVSYNQKFLDMWRIPESVAATGDDNKALSYVLNQLENPDAFLEKVRSLYQQPEAESYDAIRFKDGRVFERYSKPQKIGGKTVGRGWSFRDVTERERSDERLKQSEEKYRALFEESKDAVFISTPDGRFLDINQAGVEMFGFPTKGDLLRVNIGRDLYVKSADR
ncbi:MAG: PAS domain S-box protein, partial [Bacteroidota bacterium]